jgi:uncharacterized protein DUF3306
MSREDKEDFLSRWSRRKLGAAKEAAAPQPAAPAAPPAASPAVAQGVAKPELPSVETLQGLASEYKDFLRPGVDEKLRQSALKKLFHDPHFNVMDGLDTYIDDYSRPDPIPDAMLRTLAHAKGLLFDDKKEEGQPAAEKPLAQSPPEAPRVAESSAEAAPAVPLEKKDKV